MKALLPYYEQELTELQTLGNAFAKKHPKIASQLGLGEGQAKDPHIARLIEAVAFMNARINYKLKDEFSDISEALLNVLYPHYLSPIPSLSMMQFSASPDLDKCVVVPKNTALEGLYQEKEKIDIARFQTCYPVDLLPIEVSEAVLLPHLHGAPRSLNPNKASAYLKITLGCLDSEMHFQQLKPKKFRFYLNGLAQHQYALYELLFQQLEDIAFSAEGFPDKSLFLSKYHLKQVGFEEDEGLLPYSAHTQLSYRLLTEFFVFPEKFLFMDVVVPSDMDWRIFENSLDIYFYLKQAPVELQHNIHAKTFALGCTPIINLFQKPLEPVSLTHTQTEYLLTPDIRQPDTYEIYDINAVSAVHSSGEITEYLPFYGMTHYREKIHQDTYWYAKRKVSAHLKDETDMLISLVDSHFNENTLTDSVLKVSANCFNRHLENLNWIDPAQTHYQLSEGSAPIHHMKCLMPFTPVLRQSLDKSIQWKLISHLSSQHLSLVNDHEDSTPLKEMLQLYNHRCSEIASRMINSIARLQVKRTVTQISVQGINAFCHGTEICMVLDETGFFGNSLFLFTSVIERFIGIYASINAFIQLVVINKDTQKVIHTWEPRLGDRETL